VALEHTPLDPSQLSAAAQKALSGPMKLMAARGLAPLPNRGDLVSVLYQLSLDGDRNISGAALGSVRELPEKVLQGALGDASVDSRVLDFFAREVRSKPRLVQVILLNAGVADETVAALAAKVDNQTVDLISQNEERLLRCPAIISAMYSNLNARMSTVDRAVELAVRAGLKVSGIPAWDEVVAALMGQRKLAERRAEEAPEAEPDPELEPAVEDEIFASAAEAAAEGDDAGEELPISKMTVPMKIRLATLGNKFQRSLLIRDSIKLVSVAAIKAPGVTDAEAARYASNHSLSDDVISFIASRRDWTKMYGVKLSLVMNPKTPIPAAIRFLGLLRPKDLKAVARSKGIPQAVAVQAKKRVQSKESPGGKHG